ncbi:MAG: acetate--CoA ligase [Flavobacteriales bacterium]|nr:acetate--CoA ligase [Flavobacteriales bacterium]
MKIEINSLKDYQHEYEKSIFSPEEFWEEKANDFVWKKKFEKVLEWNFDVPVNRWYIGGKLNITESCLDRHLEKSSDKIAFIWEPNSPSEKSIHISYRELFSKVCRFANVLKNNNVKRGDRVCIYLPMIPELVVAMLACARIGAIHSVIYAGFSSGSLANRVLDAKAKIVITSDGAYRGEKIIPLKAITDEALANCPEVARVIVVKRTGEDVAIISGRDVWWHDEETKTTDNFPAEVMDAEDVLFILYTSGSTGKPKGIVHSCASYMVYVDYTFRNVFHCEQNYVYWCTADIGWVTGHSYLVYGPLLSGITSVMFEGIPTYPNAERWWGLVDKHKVNVFYTSPTAIRTLEMLGLDPITKHDLGSLKLLGTVGEPINESAWQWYHKNIGKRKCFIVDTWWQTETGGIVLSPLLNVSEAKPGFAMHPLPGIQPVIVNEKGEELKENDVEGNLCIKFPWPGILRTVYGDHERCKKTYFSDYPDLYFTGDGCKRDNDGHYRITGRVDDVIKVSGHLMGTAEIENAINGHLIVVESAVVGFPHAIKGNAICAFVVTYEHPEHPENLKKEILEQVKNTVGPIAKPEKIYFVKGLPKTRSGKIMRRILRKILEGERQNFGDTSTLIDQEIIGDILSSISDATLVN